MKKLICKYINKSQLSEKVWKFEFQSAEELGFVGGQYMILDCEGKGKRMYSIASSTRNQKNFTFILTYYKGGLASEYLMSLNPGSEVNMLGPLGKFVLQDYSRSVVLLVTGTGIAPALSMLSSAIHEKKHSQLESKIFWGMRRSADLFSLQELEQLQKNMDSFDYQIFLSQDNTQTENSRLHSGRFTPYLEQFLLKEKNNIDNIDFYICGNGDVVESTKHLLVEQGINRSQIYYERFN